MSDPERKYGKNVTKYKHDALIWEEIYLSIAEELKQRGLFKQLHTINAFPDNRNIISNIQSITHS